MCAEGREKNIGGWFAASSDIYTLVISCLLGKGVFGKGIQKESPLHKPGDTDFSQSVDSSDRNRMLHCDALLYFSFQTYPFTLA